MKLFRKLCCLLLCVAVFAVSLSSLCLNVFAATGTGVVVGIDSGSSLNVRSEPNTTSGKILALKNGTTVEVLGEVDGATVSSSYGSKWYHIRYDGREGMFITNTSA